MRSQLRPALVSLGLLTLLTGLLYPLVVTGLAQVVFPRQANGSLIVSRRDLDGSDPVAGFATPHRRAARAQRRSCCGHACAHPLHMLGH